MEIRRQVFNSVYELMQCEAICDITVDDILVASEVSRGSFYKYFSDKYDVINSYYADAMNLLFLNCRLTSWPEILEKQFAFLADNATFFKSAFKTHGQNSFCSYFNCQLVHQFENTMLKYGDHTELTTADKNAVQFFADGTVAYTRRWLAAGMPVTVADVAEEITALIPKAVLDDTHDEISTTKVAVL